MDENKKIFTDMIRILRRRRNLAYCRYQAKFFAMTEIVILERIANFKDVDLFTAYVPEDKR